MTGVIINIVMNFLNDKVWIGKVSYRIVSITSVH
jgi:hypothetical protein